jgi:hypothetical protein
MDSAALIGSILISSDNRDELTSLAMSALSVIDEILSDDVEFGELA